MHGKLCNLKQKLISYTSSFALLFLVHMLSIMHQQLSCCHRLLPVEMICPDQSIVAKLERDPCISWNTNGGHDLLVIFPIVGIKFARHGCKARCSEGTN